MRTSVCISICSFVSKGLGGFWFTEMGVYTKSCLAKYLILVHSDQIQPLLYVRLKSKFIIFFKNTSYIQEVLEKTYYT